MNLDQNILSQLNDAMQLEARTQQLLAEARHYAAQKIAAYFQNPEAHPDDKQPNVIRLAIQFTARIFRPLELTCREAIKSSCDRDQDAPRMLKRQQSDPRRESPRKRKKPTKHAAPALPINLTTQSVLSSEAHLC